MTRLMRSAFLTTLVFSFLAGNGHAASSEQVHTLSSSHDDGTIFVRPSSTLITFGDANVDDCGIMNDGPRSVVVLVEDDTLSIVDVVVLRPGMRVQLSTSACMDLMVAAGALTLSGGTTPSIAVGTWNPLDNTHPNLDIPEWIVPSIVKVDDNSKRFGAYDGDYECYTADLIEEIDLRYPKGGPVILTLQQAINARHAGNPPNPANVDPWGLFTHIDDRMDGDPALAGIWPDAGVQFWEEAIDYIFGALRAEGIDVAAVLFDTEVWAHWNNPPYSFDGQLHQIVSDPRWYTTPLAGFDGKTGDDIWPNASAETELQLNWLIRYISEHSFTHIKNSAIADRIHNRYPNALISDYQDYRRIRTVATQSTSEQRLALAKIMEALGLNPTVDEYLRPGMGNAAGIVLKGGSQFQGEDTLAAMIDFAMDTAALYDDDPEMLTPWIVTRDRINANVSEEIITEGMYRDFFSALVDMGIIQFMWWPTSQLDCFMEQELTVSALEDAAGGVSASKPMIMQAYVGGSANSTSLVIPDVLTKDDHGIIVVARTRGSGNTVPVNSVSFGSEMLTQVPNGVVSQANTRLEAWHISEPTAGTSDITITFGDEVSVSFAAVYVVNGHDTQSMIGAVEVSNSGGGSTTESVELATVSNVNLSVAALTKNNGVIPAIESVGCDHDIHISSGANSLTVWYQPQDGVGDLTFSASWDNQSGNSSMLVAVEIRGAP